MADEIALHPGVIFAVDDDPSILESLTQALEQRGYKLRCFPHAPEALESALEDPPELILLDVNMPEMSGYALCSRLKATPELANIPVIFMSELEESGNKLEAFRLGGADYVTKPFHFEELEARVGTHIRLWRTLQSEKRLNEVRSQFISIASHEFRTPLTTILSSAELMELLGAGIADDKREMHLQRIKSAAKHMTALLSDVLLIGKADAQRITIKPTAFDVDELVRVIVSDLRNNSPAEASVVASITGSPQRLLSDQNLVRAILQNLLSNSVKYSGGSLKVEVHVEFEADQVAITVADKGIGIPEKDQKQLFKLFHRGSNTKHVPGTGLGLAIVQRFSDVLNGKLTFHSREGEGTRFTLALPYELPYAA